MRITKIKIKLEKERLNKTSLNSDWESLLPSFSDCGIASSEVKMLIKLKQDGEME